MNLAGLRLPVDNTVGKLPCSFGLESAPATPQLSLSFPLTCPWPPRVCLCSLSALHADSSHMCLQCSPRFPKSKLCSVFFCFFWNFWLCHTACGIVAPQPGIEPTSPCIGSDHWTTREVPLLCVLIWAVIVIIPVGTYYPPGALHVFSAYPPHHSVW